MRFREAQKELAKLADGKYHTIDREITNPCDGGKQRVKCSVYIHGQKYHNGETWEEALASMKDAIANPEPKVSEPKAEPTTEDIF